MQNPGGRLAESDGLPPGFCLYEKFLGVFRERTMRMQTKRLYPFAMCSNGNMLSNPSYPVKMLDAGSKMYRLDAPFASVRPVPRNDPEEWDWRVFDSMRALKERHPGLEVLPILGYGASWAVDPKWKGQEHLSSINSPMAGADITPVNSSDNLYGHFVYEAVRRYGDIITYWESWNEPDLPGYCFFRGSGKDFFAYQKACYLAVKAANPACKVLFAGLTFASGEGYLHTHQLLAPSQNPPDTCFLEEYLKECVKDPAAKENNYYFDIINQHTYSRASDLYDYTAVDQKLMKDYLGDVKPVWITEMGATDANNGTFDCSPEEYCDYILQSFAWGSLAGVERFFHFQLDNSNGHGLYQDMLGDPKIALAAYRDILTKEFADVVFRRQMHGTKGVNFLSGNSAYHPTWKAGYQAFEFQREDGEKRVMMAFADTSRTIEMKIPATQGKQAVLIDRLNQRSPISPQEGAYTVTLPGATNVGGWAATHSELGTPEHMIGGATVIIVEQ